MSHEKVSNARALIARLSGGNAAETRAYAQRPVMRFGQPVTEGASRAYADGDYREYARGGRYNPNQPRAKDGKWTSAELHGAAGEHHRIAKSIRDSGGPAHLAKSHEALAASFTALAHGNHASAEEHAETAHSLRGAKPSRVDHQALHELSEGGHAHLQNAISAAKGSKAAAPKSVSSAERRAQAAEHFKAGNDDWVKAENKEGEFMESDDGPTEKSHLSYQASYIRNAHRNLTYAADHVKNGKHEEADEWLGNARKLLGKMDSEMKDMGHKVHPELQELHERAKTRLTALEALHSAPVVNPPPTPAQAQAKTAAARAQVAASAFKAEAKTHFKAGNDDWAKAENKQGEYQEPDSGPTAKSRKVYQANYLRGVHRNLTYAAAALQKGEKDHEEWLDGAESQLKTLDGEMKAHGHKIQPDLKALHESAKTRLAALRELSERSAKKYADDDLDYREYGFDPKQARASDGKWTSESHGAQLGAAQAQHETTAKALRHKSEQQQSKGDELAGVTHHLANAHESLGKAYRAAGKGDRVSALSHLEQAHGFVEGAIGKKGSLDPKHPETQHEIGLLPETQHAESAVMRARARLQRTSPQLEEHFAKKAAEHAEQSDVHGQQSEGWADAGNDEKSGHSFSLMAVHDHLSQAYKAGAAGDSKGVKEALATANTHLKNAVRADDSQFPADKATQRRLKNAPYYDHAASSVTRAEADLQEHLGEGEKAAKPQLDIPTGKFQANVGIHDAAASKAGEMLTAAAKADASGDRKFALSQLQQAHLHLTHGHKAMLDGDLAGGEKHADQAGGALYHARKGGLQPGTPEHDLLMSASDGHEGLKHALGQNGSQKFGPSTAPKAASKSLADMSADEHRKESDKHEAGSALAWAHQSLAQGKESLAEGKKTFAGRALASAGRSAAESNDAAFKDQVQEHLQALAKEHGLHNLGEFAGAVDGHYVPSEMHYQSVPDRSGKYSPEELTRTEAVAGLRGEATEGQTKAAYKAIEEAAGHLRDGQEARQNGDSEAARSARDRASAIVDKHLIGDDGDYRNDIHPHARALAGYLSEAIGNLRHA